MHIFSVRTLTQAIKNALDGEFPFVWVPGQVLIISRPSSGHIFISFDNEVTG
jgi:exodeoxyribonuclease VII large subunit